MLECVSCTTAFFLKILICQVWNCSYKLLDFATLCSHHLQCQNHHYKSNSLCLIFVCVEISIKIKHQVKKAWEEDTIIQVCFSSVRLKSSEFNCSQWRKINISKGKCSKLGSCSETCPISHRSLPPPINLTRTHGNMTLLCLGNIIERGYSKSRSQ